MANFKIEKKKIYISGDISISEGESLFNFLNGLPFYKDEVVVDLIKTDSWDTSSIQTFISWIKSSENLIIWKNIPKEMLKDIEMMGLATLFSRS